MKPSRIFTIIGAGLLGFSTYKWYMVQYNEIYNIKLKVSEIKFVEKTFSNVKMRIKIQLTNPSDVGFNLTSYDLNIKVMDKFVANVKNKGMSLDVPCCGQSSYLSFEVEFNPVDLLDNVFQIAQQIIESINVKVEVRGNLGIGFGRVQLATVPMKVDYQAFDENPT
jgi:hypothetical protein